jgi:hypothetical protein
MKSSLFVSNITDGVITLSTRNMARKATKSLGDHAALHMVKLGPTLDITDYVLSGGRVPPVDMGSLGGPDSNRPNHSSGEVNPTTSTPRLDKDDTT